MIVEEVVVVVKINYKKKREKNLATLKGQWDKILQYSIIKKKKKASNSKLNSLNNIKEHPVNLTRKKMH